MVDIEHCTCTPYVSAGDSQSRDDLVNEACDESSTDTTGCTSNGHNGSEPTTDPVKQCQKERGHRCKCVANTTATIVLMLVIAALVSVPVIVFEVKTQVSTVQYKCIGISNEVALYTCL